MAGCLRVEFLGDTHWDSSDDNWRPPTRANADVMREHRAVRVHASYLLIFVGVAALAVGLGVALLRTPRWGVPGWLVLFAGLVPLALLVLAQITGRLGLEHLWFRSPSFYFAAVILASAGVWWLRRPALPALRFGLPATLLGCIAIVALIARLHGPSAPLAMLLPTLDAPAPELIYFDTTGHERTLAELRGKVVLLNFWATWCGPCRLEMPLLSKLQREHASQGRGALRVAGGSRGAGAVSCCQSLRWLRGSSIARPPTPTTPAITVAELPDLARWPGAHRWSGRPHEPGSASDLPRSSARPASR